MSAIDSQLPSSSGQDRPTDEVDRILSPGKLIILGLQHVLVIYAGAVAVPLMIGDRLGLSKEAIAMLISSDLFAAGSSHYCNVSVSAALWGSACR